jgi:hypothetical protein
VNEFKDLFSSQLRAKPADIPAMTIDVDLPEWESNKNRGPARKVSVAKMTEIHRQIAKMMDSKVIAPSLSATEYSHVILTPKPNNKWRFCIDYRALNKATRSKNSWPIPNIQDMLQRLGNKKSKYFGVMDLTSVYYQTELSSDSRRFSAFITHMGVFEWLRTPMGLKGAPSYFQQHISTTVLHSLIYNICEVYIDDIIVHGQTEEEYLKNMRAVFERFRQFGLTLNPEKCKFGLSEVQCVGHTINEKGIHFSEEIRNGKK